MFVNNIKFIFKYLFQRVLFFTLRGMGLNVKIDNTKLMTVKLYSF